MHGVEPNRAAAARVRLEVIPGGASRPGPDAGAGDETQWVLRARDGDVAAREVLFRRHLRPVRQRVLRLLGPDAEIDDVVQEAFLRAFEGLTRLAEPRAFGAWLSTIAVHLVDRRLRRRRLLRRLGFVPPGDGLDALEAVASNGVSPALAAEARAVYTSLDRLPTEARVAFLLRRLEGMTVPEIALHMGISERTVKRRIVLAEHRLASILEIDVKEGGEE
jgi:RNA polymerase sigma-70 factor (ECF subfamily)